MAIDSPWPERVPELIRWFEHRNPDGSWLSAGEIAAKMRLDRGAVSRKLNSLNLKRGSEPPALAEARKGDRPKKPPRLRRPRAGESTLPPLASLTESKNT